MLRDSFLVIMLGLLVTACGSVQAIQPTQSQPATDPPTAKSSSTPESASSWQLAFQISGGIAGTNQSLTLDDAGNLEVREDEEVILRTTLPDERLQSIATLLSVEVSKPDQDKADGEIPEPCPDCFQYQINLRWGGESIQIKEDDSSLPDSPHQALIQELRSLLQETQKGE